MESVDETPTGPRIGTVIVAVGMIALLVGQVVLVLLTTNLAAAAEGALKRPLSHTAWLALALLGLQLLLATWMLMQYLHRRLRRLRRGGPTEYVDAWAEAGRRLQVGEEDDDDDEQGPEADEA